MCCNKEFDIILVIGVYHITRDTIEFLKLEKMLIEYNVKIYSKCNDSFVEVIEYLNKRSIESFLEFLNQLFYIHSSS